VHCHRAPAQLLRSTHPSELWLDVRSERAWRDARQRAPAQRERDVWPASCRRASTTRVAAPVTNASIVGPASRQSMGHPRRRRRWLRLGARRFYRLSLERAMAGMGKTEIPDLTDGRVRIRVRVGAEVECVTALRTTAPGTMVGSPDALTIPSCKQRDVRKPSPSMTCIMTCIPPQFSAGIRG
jgi:hypothetical protein